MKRCIFSFFILLNCLLTAAQHKFEPGYFVDNGGVRTECLIKNKGWKENPITFVYKLSEGAAQQEAVIGDIKEFGVSNSIIFERFKILIDKTKGVDRVKEPNYLKDYLFLRRVIDGKADLYSYEFNDVVKLFFRTDDFSIPEQLLYKQYQKDRIIRSNDLYKNQIWEKMKCSEISFDDVMKLEFSLKKVTRFFIDYNECAGVQTKSYIKKRKWTVSMLGHGDLRYTNTRFVRSQNRTITQFKNKLAYSLGLSIEFISPFKNRKWALVLDPTIGFLEANNDEELLVDQMNLSYSSFELPLGFRYFMFLSDNNRLFLNGFVIYDVPFNSSFTPSSFEVANSISFAFGMGYEWKKRISAELRFLPRRNIINVKSVDLYHRFIALNIGYRFL